MKTTLIEIALVCTFGLLLVGGLIAMGAEPTPLEMAIVGAVLIGAIVASWRRGTTKTQRQR